MGYLTTFKEKSINHFDQRRFQTIRLSLLSTCNFSCVYCKTDDSFCQRALVQKPKFFIGIIKNLRKFINIYKIHLTGGEPTLYPYLEEIVYEFKLLNIPEVSITTNGTLLKRKLNALALAGLNSINLSLDGLENQVLQKMGTKKNFSFYDDLIQTIQNYKMNLKINTTILKGFNDNQILDLLEYCGKRNITIRFLEYMKMGVTEELHKQRFFSQKEILELIQTKYKICELPREKHSTSKYWITKEGYKFGIIANHSDPFCHDCDRLRIDSNGNLYGCITQNKGIPYSQENLEEILKKSLQFKQNFFIGSSHLMYQLGG